MAYDPDPVGLGNDWLNQILGGPMTGYGAALGGQMTGAAGGYLGTGGLPTFSQFGGASPLVGGGNYGAPSGMAGPGNWFDSFPGAAPAYSGYQSPIQSLYQNYQPAPMSTYPALQAYMAPPQMAPSFAPPPQGIGGYGSALAQTTPGLPYSPFGAQQYSPQQLGGQQYGQQLGGAQQYSGLGGQQYGQQARGGQQAYGQQAGRGTTAGLGQQAGAPQQAYGQPYQGGQTGQQYGYSGGATAQAPQQQGAGVQAGAGQFASPLPPGAVYGKAKWSGNDAVDMFVRRGTPVYAPTDGTMGSNGILQGNNGWTFGFKHGQTTATGAVRKGQQIGVVNDPGLDMLGRAPWGNMPDNFQHLEMSISAPGQSTAGFFKAGGGGGVNPYQWLQSIGYQGQAIERTPGPTDVQGGGGYLGGGGGLGSGGFPSMSSGFPGMQQGGFSGLGGQQMGLGGYGGMQQSGFNPLSMLQGMGQQSYGGYGGGFGF